MRLDETALDKLLRKSGYTRKELCKEIGMAEALQCSIVTLIDYVYEDEK